MVGMIVGRRRLIGRLRGIVGFHRRNKFIHSIRRSVLRTFVAGCVRWLHRRRRRELHLLGPLGLPERRR